MSHPDPTNALGPAGTAELAEANVKLRSATDRLRQLNQELEELVVDFGRVPADVPREP